MLKTYTKTKTGSFADSELVEWKPYESILVSPWSEPYKPYRIGKRVVFKNLCHWYVSTGSVYNWINNTVYGKRCFDRSNTGIYLLSYGGKHCAGNEVEKRDIFVDGNFYYYVKDAKVDWTDATNEEGKKISLMHSSFVIDSFPMDTPVVLKAYAEEQENLYMVNWVVGPYKFTINHLSDKNRKWLNKKLKAKLEKAMLAVLKDCSETCSLFD